MLGSICKTGNIIDVYGELCDVETGNLIGPANTEASRVEDIRYIANELTEQVGKLLNVSLPENTKPLNINNVTTTLDDANKHYWKGREFQMNWKDLDAAKEFREAIKIDPTFAMAHAQLDRSIFQSGNILADNRPALEAISLAKKYSSRDTHKAKYRQGRQ